MIHDSCGSTGFRITYPAVYPEGVFLVFSQFVHANYLDNTPRRSTSRLPGLNLLATKAHLRLAIDVF